MSIIFFRILRSIKNKPNSWKGICIVQIRADQVVKNRLKNLVFHLCISIFLLWNWDICVILPCLLREQGPHSISIIIKKVLNYTQCPTKKPEGKVKHALDSDFRSFSGLIERLKNMQWASGLQSSLQYSLPIRSIFIYFKCLKLPKFHVKFN